MSVADWKTIYRAYSGEELTTEIEELKADLKHGLRAQGGGGTSHERDLSELRDRLNAATQIQREKSGKKIYRRGQVDFGETDFGDF
jgi:ribosomal protein L29